MHFFASTLAVLGIALFYRRVFRRDLSQVISAAIFSVCMALYAMSILSMSLRLACGLIMGMGWCFLLINVSISVRHRSVLRFIDDLPALLLYILCAILSFTYLYDKLAIGWDEFSHWMLTLKNMHYFDNLALGEFSSTEYTSYPPALQLFEYFHLVFCPEFREPNAFMARTMLLVSTLFAPAFHKTRSLAGKIVKFFVLLFSPAALYASVYSMLYVDAVFGFLFAHLLWIYYSEERFDGFFVFSFALCGSVLSLVKGTGTALFLFALIIISADLVIRRQLQVISSNSQCKLMTYIAAAALIPMLVSYSWQLYMQFNHIGDFWQTSSSITIESIQALLTSPKDYQIEALHAFIKNMRASFRLGFIPLSFALYPFIFFVLCLLGGICAGNPRRGAMLGITLSSSYCIYAISILITYLFLFTPTEAASNASFRRYMNNQALSCWIVCLNLLLNPSVLAGKECIRSKAFALKKLQIAPIKLFSLFLAFCFPVFSGAATSVIQQYLNARQDAQYVSQYRSQQSHLVSAASYIKDKSSRIWYIYQDCNGDQYYMARMHVAPLRVNRGEFSLAASSENVFNEFTVVKTAQQWSDALAASYNYVYCNHVTEAFISDYGFLFESPESIMAPALYQVIPPENGKGLVKLRLVMIPVYTNKAN